MEELELIVEFIERVQNYRGSNEVENQCVIKVTEEGLGFDAVDEFIYESWDQLKEKCPTFKDVLYSFFESDHWYFNDDRSLCAKKVIGYEGLYEDIDSVAINNEEE